MVKKLVSLVMEVAMTLLLLHQDMDLIQDIAYSFEKDGRMVISCQSIQRALNHLEESDFEAILSGFYLQDGTVIDFRRRMVTGQLLPMIVLSKDKEEKNLILSLEYGCDDYMVYPISLLELKTRLRAIQRRCQGVDQKEKDPYCVHHQDFKFDLVDRILFIQDEEVDLTNKEFTILLYLISDQAKVFSRQELGQSIWDEKEFGDLRTVDVYIRRIRKKLSKYGKGHVIKTRWKQGYYFMDYLED